MSAIGYLQNSATERADGSIVEVSAKENNEENSLTVPCQSLKVFDLSGVILRASK